VVVVTGGLDVVVAAGGLDVEDVEATGFNTPPDTEVLDAEEVAGVVLAVVTSGVAPDASPGTADGIPDGVPDGVLDGVLLKVATGDTTKPASSGSAAAKGLNAI
jgi:hypothetical protein